MPTTWIDTTTCNETATVWVAWTTADATTYDGGAWTLWADGGTGCTVLPLRENVAEARIDHRHRVTAQRRDEEARQASARALALLLSLLSARQREQYELGRAFEVAAASGRRYRLRLGWAGNVDELDAGGRAVARLCLHPSVDVPDEDNLVAQKLLLEHDEQAFRRTANVTPIGRAA